jgi:hypothetical protein
MQTFDTFLQKHPHSHLVVGWTRNVNRWRDDTFFQLVEAQKPAGRHAAKRDFDIDRGQYLVFAAFEHERDARKLAEALGAEKVDRFAGYGSQRGFKYASKLTKTLKSTLTRRPV